MEASQSRLNGAKYSRHPWPFNYFNQGGYFDYHKQQGFQGNARFKRNKENIFPSSPLRKVLHEWGPDEHGPNLEVV